MDSPISARDVDFLLAGSRRLDEMKAEIHATVTMAIGLLQECAIRPLIAGAQIEYAHLDVKWTLYYWGDCHPSFELKARVKIGSYPLSTFKEVEIYTSTLGYLGRDRSHIPMLHRVLPSFLEQLIRKYPRVEELLEFFIRIGKSVRTTTGEVSV